MDSRYCMRNLLSTIIYKAGSCATAVVVLCLALTATYCSSQLLLRQALPVAHDMAFHLFQAGQFADAVGDGTLLPRWAAGSNNGHGSPNFIFYSPLSYYFAALLKFMVGSLPLSLVISIWFSFFFSGIAMFRAAVRLSGRGGALPAAVFYQLLPFHLLDLYARGTFAELFAFTWFPLIILCAHRVFTAENKAPFVCGLSLSYGGLILTHLVSGYIFTFVLALYLAFNYLIHRDKRAFSEALFAQVAGLGLSAFYLLPAVFERKYVQIDYIVSCQVGDFRRNFLFLIADLQQGVSDYRLMLHAAAVLELVLFLSLVLALPANREENRRMSPHHCFMALFLFAFFLTIPLSGPIWELIPGFATLQFPWRWLSVMELSLCFLMGRVFCSREECPVGTSPPGGRLLMYSLSAILLVSLVIIGKSDKTHPAAFAGYPVAREYTPTAVADLGKLLAEKKEQVSTVSGVAASAVRRWHAERRVVEVNAATPALVRIATSYYPGWQAEVDGLGVPIGIENRSGAMLIGMPQGRHTLTLNFVDTPVRRLAKYLSLFSLATLLLYIGLTNRKRAEQ